MIRFKACPRCQTGDLSLAEDIYGKYVQCMQCGHLLYPKSEEHVSRANSKIGVKGRVAA